LSTIRTLVSAALLFSLAAVATAATPRSTAPDKKRTAAKTTLAKAAARPAKTSSVVVVRGRNGALRRVALVRAEPSRPSIGQLSGLHDADEILFSKNAQAVLPIASLTKLMTAVVVTESGLPLDEPITISDEDIDTEKGSRSRLRVGTTLSRGDLMHLALMSSENRAAHALGRTYPGGMAVFVAEMNHKARELGMRDTRYVEPTGLSSANRSSARDLATLVKAAHDHQIIRELSTSHEYEVEVGNRPVQFRNTNGLVKSPEWEIGLQKTGYISEAGRCLVMQAKLAGRHLIIVFLDSAGKYSRIGDAERVRLWLTESAAGVSSLASAKPKL
jgi:D-alanyl-D-alanine endopeptidase (penicillin-binding protein 7)